MVIIGVDFGGTKIAAGIVSGGKVTRRVELPTQPELGRAHVLGQLREAITKVSGGKKAIVGIGVPGTFTGTKLLALPNVSCVNGVTLAKELRGFRILIDNDARCAARAERVYGAGKGKKNQVLVILGTGVGSCITIDGKPYLGARGSAGEIGHQITALEASSFSLGEARDWESLLSGPAMVRRHKARGGVENTPAKIWSSRSAQAHATREETVRLLAIFLANLQTIIDPEVIILSGGLAHLPLADEVNKILPRFGARPIVKTRKLADAGLIGAAMLGNGD